MIYEDTDQILKENYELKDITAVYAVRASDFNPWVISRIKLIKDYYETLPRVLIVDFGSDKIFANEIEKVCDACGFEYKFVQDQEIFSPAIARNIGFSSVKTKLVFFNDIDCFSGQDLFTKLVDAANDFMMSTYFDRILNLPVYHFTEETTTKIEQQINENKRIISESLNNSIFTKRWQSCEFVAPYSNIFLCRTDFFDYIGGYNESFRGHGSEDFEFLLRYSLYCSRFPSPALLDQDYYAPTRDSFYKDAKRYKGFRQLFEMMSLEAETYGLRVAHLYHPKPDDMPWIKSNDWKRNIFSEETSKYLKNKKELVNLDWLPRKMKLLALVKHEDHFNFIFPLRSLGYKIEYFDLIDNKNQAEVIKKIDSGYFDAVCIFNPYMKSHTDLYLYFEYAKNKGVKTIVIERGALPESWYYADDMAYVDPDYDQINLQNYPVMNEILIEKLFARIKTGNFTLECNGDFQDTFYKYKLLLTNKTNKKIFIPLQLSDDSAVTRFVGNLSTYEDFIENLKAIFIQNPDVIFLLKKHPLSKNDDFKYDLPDNVYVCDELDNVHALIELSDAVLCYNSGVGLLALIHEKPVFTVGRSFYSKQDMNLAIPVHLPETALDFFKKGKYRSPVNIRKFVSWLIFEKYSFYKSDTVIRDFGDRKSHGYKNSKFYSFRYKGFSIVSKSLNVDHPFSLISYGAAKLHVSLGIDLYNSDIKKPMQKKESPEKRPIKHNSFKKLKKLFLNPKNFFKDSNILIFRKISSIF